MLDVFAHLLFGLIQVCGAGATSLWETSATAAGRPALALTAACEETHAPPDGEMPNLPDSGLPPQAPSPCF